MVTFGFKKRKALAQIPVLLGLFIMALVVPAATKLVQENQDTRNRAASVISPPPSGCTEGYVRCINNTQQRCQNGSWVFQKNCPNGCSGNYCKVVVPTNTSKAPTSTPRASSYTCSSLGGSCVSYGCTCGTITEGTCQGEDECCRPCPTSTPKPTATLTPTKIPTSTPTRAPSPTPTTACTGTCQYSDCLTMNMKTATGKCPGPQYCCGEKIIAPICNLGDKHCADDNLGVWVCKTDKSGYTLINCSVGKKCNSVTETCVSISTPTPTKIPTSTPTRAPSPTPTTACSGTCQYSDCLTMNMKTGVGSCPRPQYCCGEKITVNKCTQGDRYCSPDKKSLFVCKSDKSGYTQAACATGRICDETTRTCVALPTMTPTRAPSPTPTTACSGTCQYSDCLTMNMKTGVGSCPRPQYCCGEKITVNKCTQGDRYCSPDKKSLFVCKSDKSGYTQAACATGRICDETTRTCVALPTMTPTRAPSPTPTTACTGTCQYSDCLTMNMKTGVGSCPRPQYCCGEKITSYVCNIGERTCLPDKSGVNICKSDRTGYIIYKCTEGRVCDPNTNTCVALPTATPATACLLDGRMTESGDKCCSKEAVYQGSSLVCKAISTSILKQPGDSCSKDEDCASGKCKATTLGLFNKKCISLKVSGDTCSNNSDCTSGICDEKICKEVGEAGFVCKPGEFKCSDSKTLLTCTETGSGWIKQACSSCVNNVCNDLDSYPVCSGGLEDSDYDCPANWACTGAKVPDKIGLWYCEPKSAVNANPICTPGALRCNGSNSQASLETCSPDGRRWLSTLTCPLALSMAGYNYSCKQITSLEAQCRPPTEEEMKKFAVEFVAMNAAAVAMPFAIGGAATTIIPAMMANPAIVSGAFRVIRIGNAVYAINNAANECQGFESMNDNQKMKCVLAAGYAVTATVDGGLAGAGFVSKGSAILSGIEVGNDVANLALGGVNAYNQCQGGTDRDCYYALISSGIDLVSLGVDINQAKQWSKTNLITKAEEIPKIITNPENIIETENKFDVLPSEWKNTIDKIIDNQPTNISILPNAISGDDELITVFRGLGTQFSEFDVRNLTDNPQTAGLLRNLPQDQIETAIDYMKSQGVDFNYRAIQHKGNTALSPFLGFTTDPSMASQFAGEGGTVIVAKIPKSELFDLDYIRNSTGWNGGFTDEAEVAILGTLDPSRVVEIYNAPPSQWKINQLIEWGATLDQIYIKQSILTNFN